MEVPETGQTRKQDFHAALTNRLTAFQILWWEYRTPLARQAGGHAPRQRSSNYRRTALRSVLAPCRLGICAPSILDFESGHSPLAHAAP